MIRNATPQLDRFIYQQKALGFDSRRQDLIDLAEALRGDVVALYERMSREVDSRLDMQAVAQ